MKEYKHPTKQGICSDCGEDTMLNGYLSRGKLYHYKRCNPCRVVYNKPYATKETRRRTYEKRGYIAHMRRKFDLTEEEYTSMLKDQKGVCAICRGDNNGKRLHIDHDHQTNAVRALLCNNCNGGIGFFQDNYLLLQRAADYLLIHSAGVDEP